MRDFFATVSWRQDHGSMHVYVLPSDRQRAELSRLQDRLIFDGSHARQPVRWLHATVLRLPIFVDDAALPALIAALDDALGSLPAFGLVLNELSLGEHGVRLEGANSDPWRQLIATVETAARSVLDSDVWFDPPAAPHISLSYGVADAETHELERALAGLRHSVQLQVDNVELLAVDLHRRDGIFTWVDVAAYPLAR